MSGEQTEFVEAQARYNVAASAFEFAQMQLKRVREAYCEAANELNAASRELRRLKAAHRG